MKRCNTSFIILILTILLLSGCDRMQNTVRTFDIPEAEKLQQLLDDMSQEIVKNNVEAFSGSVSESCPGRKRELEALKKLVDSYALSSYSQTIVSARRLRDGVVCTVNISWEGTSENRTVENMSMKNIYFIYENALWKIGDLNYHPYVSPTVVVGSESTLYNAAYRMSETLDSKLRTDTEHLQSYGDIILVGTPYDNASILELEEKGLTEARVTDEYPGNGLGIVQVLSNVENYRHLLIIQGNERETAENAIYFMTQYIRNNPYLNPGVYFIEENSLRAAAPLELTSLVTLDAEKASQRLKEVQKQMEANIAVMEEELLDEVEQLNREQRYTDNKYNKEYSRVFSRYEFYPEHSLYDSMTLINADYSDIRLCTSIFRLPYGGNAGTAHAYADYMYDNISLADDKFPDDKGPLLGDNISHTLAAHEIDASANELELSAFSTAILRLSGFSANQVYTAATSYGNSVYLNIDAGYSIAPGSPVVSGTELQLPAGRLASLYNDIAFISYEENTSNLTAEEVSLVSGRAGKLFSLKNRTSGKTPKRVPFGESELSEPLGMPNDSEEVYKLLRNTYIEDDSPCLFSTLEEAREQLRSSMGRLLAAKCTRYLVNTAARYPMSQFDLARYASGLINVEHPNAYAEAAENSIMIKQLSGGISNILSDTTGKTVKMVEILEGITEEEQAPGRFSFPDHCAVKKLGSHWDKALLAFGLYSKLTGDPEDAYIALGESSSYLVFPEEDGWKYLDCKYNTVRDFIQDEIYAVFNKDFVYNRDLEIGYLPEFIK